MAESTVVPTDLPQKKRGASTQFAADCASGEEAPLRAQQRLERLRGLFAQDLIPVKVYEEHCLKILEQEGL